MRELWNRIRLWWARRRRKPRPDDTDVYRRPPSQDEFMRDLYGP
jgi:hypothetical protein